jgi:MoaA/NifB/PqqE/SkfB family radical SAM enzyme
MTDNEFNAVELANSSKTFCIYPWIHQYIGTAGDIKPCCVYTHASELGNLKENSLKEIWNNDATKKLRLKLLNGEEEPNCKHCNNSVRKVSDTRTNGIKQHLEKNRDNQQILNSTLSDGTVPVHKLTHIDVRFNNLCNFACRTCSPHFSTNWVLDNRKLLNLTEKKEINDGFQFPGKHKTHALEEITPHLATVQSLYFAGGEPLMQEEHYQVLQYLIQHKNINFGIIYNTNFSKLKLGDHNVINYWKHFKSVYLNASIDGSYKKAEYWRHGTVWTDIVDNFKQIEKYKNIMFSISYSLSWVNAHNLVELHKEWIELNYIKPDQLYINIIDGPLPYSLKNIPDWKKEQIEKIFRDHIQWLSQLGDQYEVDVPISLYLEAIEFMNNQPTGNLHRIMKDFSKLTKKLDEIRNENFFETFPEHVDINEYMTENNLHVKFKY